MLMMRNDEMDPTEITPHLCLVHVVCKIIFFFLHKCVCQCKSENNMADSNPLLDTGTISLSNQNFFSQKKNNKFQTAVSLPPKGENSLKLPSTYHIESRMF